MRQTKISNGLRPKNYETRKGLHVCSNHFKLGKLVGNFNYPALYLIKSDAESKTTPVKRNLSIYKFRSFLL